MEATKPSRDWTRAGALLAVIVAGGVAVGPSCGGPYHGGWSHENWPLVGQHATLACDQCHPASSGLQEVSSSCMSCHEPDRPENHYEGQDCGQCHTAYGWDAANINHDFLPLTFSHDLPCETCHTNGAFDGLDKACASCHESSRPAVHDPGDCGTCHTWTTWSDVSYDHTFGVPHHGYGECTTCHTDAPDAYAYEAISCFAGCHQHDQSTTNAQHNEVGGYRYETSACLDCHPTGGGGGD